MTTGHRQYERFKVKLKVEIVHNNERLGGFSRDISLGGMFVETMEKHPPYGSEVTLEVDLPSMTDRAKIPAIVRWSSSEGIGLQFRSLRAVETWAINQLTSK